MQCPERLHCTLVSLLVHGKIALSKATLHRFTYGAMIIVHGNAVPGKTTLHVCVITSAWKNCTLKDYLSP